MSFVTVAGLAYMRVGQRSRATSQAFLTMRMSLEGFITGPEDDAQSPAGIEVGHA
jgi:hypothetical protein